MSTIERMAELAKGATQGEWVWVDNGGWYDMQTPEGVRVLSDGSACGEYREDIVHNSPDGLLVAACNPAAIAQAHAEYAELKQEIGLMTIDRDYYKRMFGIADQCAHERETALLANGRTIAELERRNAELVAKVLLLADVLEAALSSVESMQKFELCREIEDALESVQALGHTQEKADAAE